MAVADPMTDAKLTEVKQKADDPDLVEDPGPLKVAQVPALAGLGVWLWEVIKCDGGDLDKIAARCLRSGVRWVAIKAGGSVANGQVTRARVETLRSAGLEVAAWWYCVPGPFEERSQLEFVRSLVETQGVQHLICDAEIEWESVRSPSGMRVPADRRQAAARFAGDLREAVGFETWLADAPWPIVRAHRGWPWREFGVVMDARMDQLYWKMGDKPFTKFADWADDNWRDPLVVGDVRCPLGSTVDFTGTHHAPISELAAFLDRYARCPARSLWSYQHLDEAEWALLEERATIPPPASDAV